MLDRAMLFVVTETPLHAGGGTSLGSIDLPIQRERHTHYPMIQASGVKGALRDLAYRARDVRSSARGEALSRESEGTRLDDQKADRSRKRLELEAAFGPETDRADIHAGALSFADARILLFPVRSLEGVFAWVTSPFVLQRFARELERTGYPIPWRIPSAGEEEALTGSTSTVSVDGSVVLEEYDFIATKDSTKLQEVDQIAKYLAETLNVFSSNSVTNAYWSERLWGGEGKPTSNLVILSDTAFRDFVVFSTEVVTRIRVDPVTGTVERGALWSEEHLPSDSVLYVPIVAGPVLGPLAQEAPAGFSVMKLLAEVLESDEARAVQLGGDETVGRGFTSLKLLTPTTEG